jgi:hypothetical protein
MAGGRGSRDKFNGESSVTRKSRRMAGVKGKEWEKERRVGWVGGDEERLS